MFRSYFLILLLLLRFCGFLMQDVPQMILLTFQNAINDNFKIYQQLFKNLINPNKCAGRGTFFVSHNYTDYFYVQSLYALRHEIADNSVTWQGGSDYWAHGSVETWFQELNGRYL